MSQLKNVVDPFAEVNVYPLPDGRSRVVATILMAPQKEGAQTGIALDGSGSMRKLYGQEGGGRVLSPIFGGAKKPTNEITPIAQKVCSYLARNLDADGGTTCVYWAVGPGGSEIEVIGDLTADQAEKHTFGPPQDFGTGTQLLPAVRYFVERFKSAPWGFYVFITDGELHDLDDVIAYTKRLAQEISRNKRHPLKLVLIGVGPEVNEKQMEELDDLDTGTEVDLWDHKIASEMRALEQIFAEVVDKNARVADNGKILDPQGKVVRDFAPQGGLPAFLEFEVPAGLKYFTLDVNGTRVHQTLNDSFHPPASGAPTAAWAASTPASAPGVPVATPVLDAEPAMIDEPPVDPVANDWSGLALEFGTEPTEKSDIDLEQHKDK